MTANNSQIPTSKNTPNTEFQHYGDAIMGEIASQITSLTIVYSAVYSGTDQRKNQSCAPLAFVRGIHRGPVNSPHKGLVTRKMFPFDDVIMTKGALSCQRVWLRETGAGFDDIMTINV